MSFVLHRDLEGEADFRGRLNVIGSFPRSGSHWLRRMLAELVAINNGLPSPKFGKEMAEVAGFHKDFEDGEWRKSTGPLIVATHQLTRYGIQHMRVYLRRDFEEVYRSTLKATHELDDVWWYGGSREACYEKWCKHQAQGVAHATLVLDYNVTKADPRAAVKAVCAAIGLPYTKESLDRAIAAGSRENMLAEQSEMENVRFEVVNKEGATL